MDKHKPQGPTPPTSSAAPDGDGGTGLPHPADRAIAERAATPEAPPPVKPVDADWTPGDTDAHAGGDAAVAPPDVGILESIGRAVSAPVKDAGEADRAAGPGTTPKP